MKNSKNNLSERELFVRGQDHISSYKGDESGLSLTRAQVSEYFGERVFDEIEDYGSAIIPACDDEPSKTLREARESLGLSISELASAVSLNKSIIERAEDKNHRSDIRNLAKIAQFLGIKNDLAIGTAHANSDKNLGARLKSANNSTQQKYTASIVAKLSEAGWVITTQNNLLEKLGDKKQIPSDFSHDTNYGSADYPAHLHGYWLAARTREILGIGESEPIESMRKILEDDLGISVVWSELGGKIAGATVSLHGCRGIVLNSKFRDGDVATFRFTMAHELAHILWDGDDYLDNLIVDSFQSLKKPFSTRHTTTYKSRAKDFYIEARANAFAAEFLAPRKAAFPFYSTNKQKTKNKISGVMENFGVGYHCAKHQIENHMNGIKIRDDESFPEDMDPTRCWVSSERKSYAADLANIKLSRGSAFSEVVVRSLINKIITEGLALSYLDCKMEDLKKVERLLS